MHPVVVITIDGHPVSGLFLSRLLSVSVADRAGKRSDTIDLELEAGPPFFVIPRKKAIITAAFGYAETGVADFGSFTADDITLKCLPYQVKIQAPPPGSRRGSSGSRRIARWSSLRTGPRATSRSRGFPA